MMDSDAADRLLGELASQGGSEVTLTGGEPLLFPAIERLTSRIQDLGLRATLYTMGLVEGARELPSQKVAQLVPLVQEWRFSLHGVTDETHDRVTGTPGSLRASIAAIESLVDAGAWVGATFVVRPDALADLRPVALMCGELGIRELRVVGLVAQGRQARLTSRLPSQVVATVEAADNLSATRVRLGDAALAQLGLPNACQAFDNELVVSVDGWVSACHMVEPTRSDDERDNVFLKGLTATLRQSPRLERLRAVSEGRGGSCRNGCLMERSMRTPSLSAEPLD